MQQPTGLSPPRQYFSYLPPAAQQGLPALSITIIYFDATHRHDFNMELSAHHRPQQSEACQHATGASAPDNNYIDSSFSEMRALNKMPFGADFDDRLRTMEFIGNRKLIGMIIPTTMITGISEFSPGRRDICVILADFQFSMLAEHRSSPAPRRRIQFVGRQVADEHTRRQGGCEVNSPRLGNSPLR